MRINIDFDKKIYSIDSKYVGKIKNNMPDCIDDEILMDYLINDLRAFKRAETRIKKIYD